MSLKFTKRENLVCCDEIVCLKFLRSPTSLNFVEVRFFYDLNRCLMYGEKLKILEVKKKKKN